MYLGSFHHIKCESKGVRILGTDLIDAQITYWKILITAEFVDMLVPIISHGGGHGPEDTPSVNIVVRHLNKSLMQRCRSLDRDKAFEAVRDNSGICVDKHCGNVSPLSCLSVDVGLRK